ncbi:hypothetical protein [Sphingomonas pokkalii]|uniref:Phosphoribosyltransferase domain-containing protein n=1 Tax=Sphingomonas pokkalii TaxID=2175090 RepID=A0A2U0SHY3_9SPHN|nr:hypothetical protein [Sphingomonas pokkalii]PVX30952.1 hypothetical protein DD559_17785 [Sphingomonas pokkalii]
MPTLDASWSPQIRKIGDLERQDHWYLTAEHECYFFGEYTARGGYSHSSTNQIITNIKKKPSLRHTQQWQYKVRDMSRVAAAIRGAINPQSYGIVTLVPIPPSKLRTDPEHDPRMAEIARLVSPNANVRELIEPIAARQPQHESEQRLDPDQLRATLTIVEAQCAPAPQNIILIDDVITTGCSFVACRRLLQDRFPGVPVWGIFAARRAVDHSADFEAFGSLGDL